MNYKPHILQSFFRYNIVAIIATTVDFLVFVFLNNVLQQWYLTATIISATLGGLTAFLLNKYWVFVSNKTKMSLQAVKYVLVWSGSIFLNTYGLYLLVEHSNLTETLAKAIVAVLVGVFYNFLMSKFFVFK